MTATERFLKYVKLYTTSDENSEIRPSTARQLDLIYQLEDEMKELGLKNIHIDSCGNVIGTVEATKGVTAPVLALVAHVDTSQDASGENVKPRIVEYSGGDIELSEGIVMEADQFPCLNDCIGNHLIVTDGTTLLGADDKAGIAEIMTAVDEILSNGLPHGELRIVFTTDEEIGSGVDGLEVKDLACDFGYTVDGGEISCYEYENFNAASAKIHINGVSIHPGSAKDIMKNAASIACRLHCLLPADIVPEKTDGYDGFIHLHGMSGEVASADLAYIIRDHDRNKLEEKKDIIRNAVDRINDIYGENTAELNIRDTYYNMREIVEQHPELLTHIEKAFSDVGVEIHPTPIRGGTDGAVLTWMGLPCPNLPTGGYNFHGVYEFIPQESLELLPKAIIQLVCSFIN